MSVSTIPRRYGAAFAPNKLDYELARRAITSRRLAEISGVHEAVISRARHSGMISERNLQKLATALLSIPLAAGVDMLLAEPEMKTAEAPSHASAAQEATRNGHTGV